MAVRQITGSDPNYETIKKLGEGAFGSVYKVRRKSDGKVLACKSIKISSPQILELVMREVAALRALVGCRNVVQWTPDIAVDMNAMTVRLHMEYYPQGDLGSFIKSRNSLVPKDTVTQIFCCMAMALLDCHKRGICHRDIKPDNILLSEKVWNGQVITVAYLADFGIGKLSAAAFTSGMAVNGSQCVGTPIYMAPESLNMMNPVYSDRSDMFALGCTFYELCNLRPAYTSAARPFVPEMSAAARLEYGSRLSPLVTNLMQLFPVLRPSTQQLVAGLEAYCVSRWQKQHTTSLWQGLAVLAKAYQQHQVAQVQAAQVQAVQQAQVQMQIQAAAQAQVQMQMQAAAQAQAYQAAAQVQQAQAMAGMQAYQYQMQAQAQAQARAQAQAQAMQMAALQQRPRQQFGFNPWNPGFPF